MPEDKTAPTPAPPLLKQDGSSKYYYVYNYTHVITLVNNAFKGAFTVLVGSLPVG